MIFRAKDRSFIAPQQRVRYGAMQTDFDQSLLSPMAGNPNPATRPMHPVATNPNRRDSRRSSPRTRNPNITSSGPLPVTRRPDITGTRGHGLRFDADRRWRLCDIHIARHRHRGDSWASCGRNFSRRGCRCHWRLVRATDQSEWRQR